MPDGDAALTKADEFFGKIAAVTDEVTIAIPVGGAPVVIAPLKPGVTGTQLSELLTMFGPPQVMGETIEYFRTADDVAVFGLAATVRSVAARPSDRSTAFASAFAEADQAPIQVVLILTDTVRVGVKQLVVLPPT